jgi:hypothetical protein
LRTVIGDESRRPSADKTTRAADRRSPLCREFSYLAVNNRQSAVVLFSTAKTGFTFCAAAAKIPTDDYGKNDECSSEFSFEFVLYCFV